MWKYIQVFYPRGAELGNIPCFFLVKDVLIIKPWLELPGGEQQTDWPVKFKKLATVFLFVWTALRGHFENMLQ